MFVNKRHFLWTWIVQRNEKRSFFFKKYEENNFKKNLVFTEWTNFSKEFNKTIVFYWIIDWKIRNEMGWVVPERKKWRKKLMRPSLLTLNKLTPGVCCLLWIVNRDKNSSYLHHTSRPTQISLKGDDLFGVPSRLP